MKKFNIWYFSRIILVLIIFVLIFCATIIIVNKNPKKVKNLKSETELVDEIKKSIRKEYYNWYINKNEIINFKKNVKIIYNDSIIEVMSLNKYNIEENIIVRLNYTSNSKEIRNSYRMLKDIQNKANITKIIKKLD